MSHEDYILQQYREMGLIREKMRGKRRKSLIDFIKPPNIGPVWFKLQRFAREHQDALYNLIFSGKLTDDETDGIITIGIDGGSCKKEHNTLWRPFLARVRERQDELPDDAQSTLNWYLENHGW